MFVDGQRHGSDDSLPDADLRCDVEQTRLCLDRLDRQVASLSGDVASLSTDVKVILHLLRGQTAGKS